MQIQVAPRISSGIGILNSHDWKVRFLSLLAHDQQTDVFYHRWHLGFCNQRYLPTRRGFQSFYGFFLGGEDYYTHVTDRMYDFFANEELDYSANGTYSTVGAFFATAVVSH